MVHFFNPDIWTIWGWLYNLYQWPRPEKCHVLKISNANWLRHKTLTTNDKPSQKIEKWFIFWTRTFEPYPEPSGHSRFTIDPCALWVKNLIQYFTWFTWKIIFAQTKDLGHLWLGYIRMPGLQQTECSLTKFWKALKLPSVGRFTWVKKPILLSQASPSF